MIRIKWLQCAAVSLAVSAVASVPMVVGFIPGEGVEVIDQQAKMAVEGMSHKEVIEHWKNPPTRTLHGMDRLKHAFNRGVGIAYIFSIAYYFAVAFPAAVIVSYLHLKQEHDA